MGQVIVRNLDDAVVRALKRRAQIHGRSLEAELRDILSQAAKTGGEEWVAAADRIRAMTPRRRQTNSTALIRQDRDR